MNRSLPLVFTLTLGLILSGSSVAHGSTSVAPSPLTADHVSVKVTNLNTQNQTGTVSLSWSSEVTASASNPVVTGPTWTRPAGVVDLQHDTHNEGGSLTRVLVGLTQASAGAVYSGSRWSDGPSAPQPRGINPSWISLGAQLNFDLNESQQPGFGPYAIICVKIRYGHTANVATPYIVCSETFQLFAGTIPPFTVTANPSLQLDGSIISATPAVFSFGTNPTSQIFACDTPITASNGPSPVRPEGSNFGSRCKSLTANNAGVGVPTDLLSAFIFRAVNDRPAYSAAGGNFVHIIQFTSTRIAAGEILTQNFAWSNSVLYVPGSGGGSATTLTAPWSPVARIASGILDITPRPSWSSGTPTREAYACINPVTAQLTAASYASVATVFQQSVCIQLSENDSVNSPVFTNDLNTAFAPGLGSRFSDISAQRPHVFYVEHINSVAVWTASVNFASDSVSAASASAEAAEPELVQFGGPLISGFSRPIVSAGTEGSFALTGKRLQAIRSAMIGGVAAEVKAGRFSAQIFIPSELAPGVYNLVLETTNGRITVLRFVTVGGGLRA